MIWSKAPTVAQVSEMARTGLTGHLGIEITEVGPDYLAAKMPVTAQHIQPFGILHGGASCVLGESLGSIASVLILDGRPEAGVGMTLTAHHLRPVPKGGTVYGVARPKHIGRKTHLWGIEIKDEQGKMVAEVTLTVMVVANEKKGG